MNKIDARSNKYQSIEKNHTFDVTKRQLIQRLQLYCINAIILGKFILPLKCN